MPADGRSIQIEGKQALFSLLGVRFGGDGKTSFNIPTVQPVPDANGKGPLLSCIAVMGVYPMRP
ncbi:hypothetical protein A6A04_18280 [Paramagnetospirillum marisnigri]|uniref:Phage tail collar domain-containing protein n=1 Tax=Paramagnetospirillum marisnigri TaxID=1285242 RepID=A0A178MQQ1_9PROT|nr:hypothetical protein A6A04_18280 [Paramagnetospirillum marisnigri]